jgi:hypothetical protein
MHRLLFVATACVALLLDAVPGAGATGPVSLVVSGPSMAGPGADTLAVTAILLNNSTSPATGQL